MYPCYNNMEDVILVIYVGIALGILLIIGIIVLLMWSYKNKYDFLFIKIKEADNNLDILLQKKEEILFKLVPILEKAKIKDIPLVIKLKSKRLDHHELYNELATLYVTSSPLNKLNPQ